LGCNATDGDGDYALCEELRIRIAIRIASEDEIHALENDGLRGEGEYVEESALQ